MFKLIVTIVVIMFVIVFATLNLHMVHIRFFTGDPVQVPVIFLIFASMILGALIPIIYNLAQKIGRNRSEHEIESNRDILEEE